jgi:hypothetical protein
MIDPRLNLRMQSIAVMDCRQRTKSSQAEKTRALITAFSSLLLSTDRRWPCKGLVDLGSLILAISSISNAY